MFQNLSNILKNNIKQYKKIKKIMDLHELVKESQEPTIKKIVLIPLRNGLYYGFGYFLAFLIMNHKFFKPLIKVAQAKQL
ncbi:hypothetical protein pb186bvf_010161 [Paramecium bursaria]